jgi:hypothetical protein
LDELTHWCLLEIVILSEAKDLLLVDRQQRAHRISLTPITIRIRARLRACLSFDDTLKKIPPIPTALGNGLHPFK